MSPPKSLSPEQPSPEHPPVSHNELTGFKKLPIEIQLIIWKHACYHPRTLNVCWNRIRKDKSKEIVAGETTAPAVLHVCKLSREVGLKVYTPCVTNRHRAGFPAKLKTGTIYINFNVDHFRQVVVFERFPSKLVTAHFNTRGKLPIAYTAMAVDDYRFPEAVLARIQLLDIDIAWPYQLAEFQSFRIYPSYMPLLATVGGAEDIQELKIRMKCLGRLDEPQGSLTLPEHASLMEALIKRYIRTDMLPGIPERGLSVEVTFVNT